MKKQFLILLTLVFFYIPTKAESAYQVNDDGEYVLYTNSVEAIARAMYIFQQGWGAPVITGNNQEEYVYDGILSSALSTDWENQVLQTLQQSQRVGVSPLRFTREIKNYGTYVNYANWEREYLFTLLYSGYTNQLATISQLQSFYSALGGLDNPIQTPIVQYRVPDWVMDASWTNYPYSFYGVGNDNATAKQLWADTRYQAQVGNNLDSLYNWGMPLSDLLDTLSNPVSGEQMVDGIPARLLEAAGKSLKFHVSMKAKTNALHAVLGFKGSNTLEKAIEEVNANLRGIAANIGQAGGGGESGGGTNEFCCYFGIAWSNFQQRTAIVLPEGVSSWDEYLQGWQQDMQQITQSGDDRLRQWWGMMYTQTLLLDRMRRETFGLGGQIARAESLSNSVDRIRGDIDQAIQDSDGWKEQVEFDMARMFVSNVAPRVLEPMENFALGLRGNGQQRKGMFRGANDEVVLLEWTGLGVRLAFDKSELSDVADTIRSAIRAFLYVVDMLLILWVGVTAFKLCGRAYQWAHSCQ